MRCFNFLIILLLTPKFSDAKVVLVEGTKETVTFTENELKIDVNTNLTNTYQTLIICVSGTFSGSKVNSCPEGYASLFAVFHNDLSTIITIDRMGKSNVELRGSIKFNDDGSLSLLIVQRLNTMTVTVINGKRIPSFKPNNDAKKAIIGAAIGIGLLLIVIVVIVALIWYFWCHRTPTHQTVPAGVPETVNLVDQNVAEGKQPSQPAPLNRQPVQIPPRDSATKHTSSSTTKPSDEKTNAVVMDQHQVAKVVVPEVKIMPKHSIHNAVTLEPPKTLLTNHTSKTEPNSILYTKRQQEKNSKTTLSTTKTIEQKSPILTVDTTQIETQKSPDSTPTPTFGTDATAISLSQNSEYKSRSYLRRSEANVFGSKPKRRVSRVVDEVEDFRRGTETYYCFSERTNLLGGHNHMRFVERIKAEVEHIPSKAERALLKAAPLDAPKFADAVVKEAEERMDKHSLNGDHRKITWDEGSLFWAMINNPATPASDGYIVMYRLAPELFKLEKLSLSDKLIQKMPLSGLYILLLDVNFPNTFRVQLAAALRQKATKIIPFVQKDVLRSAAFPTSYLALAFKKNNKSFIECREIHSKSSIQ